MKITPTRLAAGVVAGALVAISAAAPAHARAKTKSSDAIWYERIESGCKADAKRYYTAIHFQKRRAFVKSCLDRAYR